jgi:hypothetical protein
MKQPIVGGYNDALTVDSATIEYNCLMGGSTWAVENTRWNVIPTGGTISRLFVELSADPTNAGSSYTFTLMKNSIAQALTCTVAAGATTGSDVDPAHAVSVVAGDTVSLRCVASADDPAAAWARWSTQFSGTTAGESICMAIYSASTTADRFLPPQGYQAATAVAVAQSPMPTSGTFKSMYVVLSADPGTDPDAYTIALQVAAGSVNNTCTIIANNKTGNSGAATDAVNAGDLVNFIISPVDTPSVAPFVSIGIVFVSGTNGESLIFGGAAGFAGTNTYNFLCGSGGFAWDAKETNAYSLMNACTIRNLYVALDAAPGAAKTRTVSINKDAGASSGLTVTISGAVDKTGNDVAHTYDAADGDTADIKNVTDGGNARVHIGLVAYINPSTGWAKKIYGVTPTKVYGVAPTKVYGV